MVIRHVPVLRNDDATWAGNSMGLDDGNDFSCDYHESLTKEDTLRRHVYYNDELSKGEEIRD